MGFITQPHALVCKDKFKVLLMHAVKAYRGVGLEVQSLLKALMEKGKRSVHPPAAQSQRRTP
jgi:hypothetical protein